jgi:hypothetical protein
VSDARKRDGPSQGPRHLLGPPIAFPAGRSPRNCRRNGDPILPVRLPRRVSDTDPNVAVTISESSSADRNLGRSPSEPKEDSVQK